MQISLSFLDMTPTETVDPVWPTLDPVRQHEIVTMLARLIVKAATQDATRVVDEAHDD